MLKHCAANRNRWRSAVPNVRPYIYIYVYDVNISVFTRSSIYILYIYIYILYIYIYIYDISRLRVNTPNFNVDIRDYLNRLLLPVMKILRLTLKYLKFIDKAYDVSLKYSSALVYTDNTF
jgi:uncharacterized protein YggT (Ycf19 family)